MIKDSGCQYHPSCLTCPEPMCIFEYPGGPEDYFRHKELIKILDDGLSTKEASEKLGITEQSVKRRNNRVMAVLKER
jgi:hypothetical protein